MAHSHPIVDDDRRFTIDPNSRAISYDGDAITLIQGDHNSESFSFEIPRFVEGHDMSLCNQIKIHFNNTDRRKKNESKDIYPVKNAAVSDDVLVFDWLISGKATKYNGTLSFLIQFCCLEEDGTYSYLWHTDMYKGITIASSYNNSEGIAEDYSDLLEEWRSQVIRQIELSNSNIQKINEDYNTDIAKLDESYNTNIAKLDEGYNANVAKLTDAVETADQYIGDYTYKELALEIKQEDWTVAEDGSAPPYFETDTDLSFMDFNDDVSFLVEIEAITDDGPTVHLSCAPPSLVCKGGMPGPNGLITVIMGLMLDLSDVFGGDLYFQVGLNVSMDMSPKETGGIVMFMIDTMPTSFKVYKLTKTLGKRLSTILDEINGEVI